MTQLVIKTLYFKENTTISRAFQHPNRMNIRWTNRHNDRYQYI